jgi:hypothetical protein
LIQQAKLDALNFLIERLCVSGGSEIGALRADLKKLNAHLIQKYLERIEGQAPAMAAKISEQITLQVEIDQSLLDKLHFGFGQ